MNNGYSTAAAVIAGVVLETALRELCDKESISHGKLDKMNSDLTKASVYNKLVQKQIGPPEKDAVVAAQQRWLIASL